MERNEIDKKYTWDLTKFYKNNKTWYEDFNKLSSYTPKFKKYKGKLHDADKLLELFDLLKDFSLLVTKLNMYASHNLNVNLNSQTFTEMVTQLTNVVTEIESEISFVEPELLSYPESYLLSLINDERFKNKRFSLKELLRTKKHVLSENEEKLLNGVSAFAGDSSDLFDSLINVDFVFEKPVDSNGVSYELTDALISKLLKSEDRTLRKNAYTNYYQKYKEFNNTVTINYINNLKADLFFTKARKFESVLKSELYSDNISYEIFSKLNEMVNKNLNLIGKYNELRKTALKLKEYYFYDTQAPIVKNLNTSVPFESACDIVLNALKPLGDDYLKALNVGLNSRWIDVFPTKNKRSGGYQSDMYGISPVILLNYNETIEDVFTLAHEMGHAMHSYYSSAAQPYETHAYSIFLAEIASTFNEVLLTKYLYNNAKNNNEKLYYLDRYLNLFSGTIFRQMQYSNFEEYAHGLIQNNMPISKEVLNKKYYDLNAKFNKNVVNDELKSYHWSIVPHFYNSFYVYKYATGLISSVCLATGVLNKKPNALKKYINFLKSGGSDFSTSILKRAGVNLATDEPYKIAFSEMKWALNEMEKLVK